MEWINVQANQRHNACVSITKERRSIILNDTLYKIAEKNNIFIAFSDDLKQTGSCSVCVSGIYYIGISCKIQNIAELNVHIAHELGRCLTESVYELYTKVDKRVNLKLTGDEWAYKRLVPLHDLKTALKNGIYQTDKLAEYFCITEEYMKKAILFYRENNMIKSLEVYHNADI